MSQFPLDNPRPPVVSRREQKAEEIEGQAGKALSPEFWLGGVQTPVGELSRRSILITFCAILLIIMVFFLLFWQIISTPPKPKALPKADARTVSTHIFANFSGNKSAQPELFFAPTNQRFTDAYTFFWQDTQRYQVVILEYEENVNLVADYRFFTRSINPSQRSQTLYLDDNLMIEQRDLRAYGGEWRGFWLGNILLLMSPDVSRQDQQELYSHFVSIMAANQRDLIPTPTPF